MGEEEILIRIESKDKPNSCASFKSEVNGSESKKQKEIETKEIEVKL